MSRPKRIPTDKQQLKTEEIIAELQADPNPENNRKLAIYEYIKPFYRTPKDDVFRFLACRQIKKIRECPVSDHYSRILYLQPCHQRFYCMGCALWRIDHDLIPDWEKSIRSAMQRTNLFLGPMLQIRWPMLDVKDNSQPDKFREYIRTTMQDKLKFIAGIDPPMWTMITHYDVVLEEIRGVYLGPPFDPKILNPYPPSITRVVKTQVSQTTVVSGLSLPELLKDRIYTPSITRVVKGNFSPWIPNWIRSTYLLNAKDKNPHDSAAKFFGYIREALQWLAGDIVSLMELTPEHAYKLERLYRNRPLTTSRGWAYGQERLAAVDEPVLVVNRKTANGDDEIEISPTALIGAVQELETAPAGVSSGSGSGKREECPICGKTLQDSEDVDIVKHDHKPPVH